LADTKDINSTEKLLNVIRGTQNPSSFQDDQTKQVDSSKRISNKQVLNLSKFTGKSRFTLGVDIGYDHLYFAKTTKMSDGKPLLVDQKIIKYSRLPVDSEEFIDLLKSSLSSFAGSIENCEVWTMMNPAEVNVHHIKVPRVAKKQLENVIYWTAKKENPIDEKDVIFDYELQGEIIDQGIPKYSVMIYSAPRSEVEKVKNIFSSAGIVLHGITIAPFAIQNIIRTQWMDVPEKSFASLFIGNDFSRIDIYYKNDLVLTRGVKTGISSMMDVVHESISEAGPDGRAKQQKIQTLLTDILFDSTKTSDDPGVKSWVENGIFDVIAPVIERLTRQIERTLEYYATSAAYEKVERLYISSTVNIFYQPFLNYISEQLALKTEFFDPFAGKNINLSGSSLPIAERASLVQVIGLALSDRKHTPNIIFTYIEKNQEIRRTRINRGIFATFGVALLICLVVLFSQAIETKQLSVKRQALEKELAQFGQLINKEKITHLADELKLRREVNRQYAQRYKGVALIGELSSLTPENIRFIRVKMSAPVSGTPEEKKDQGVTIEGVVLGDRNILDTLLTQYVLKLENSPMLQGVSLEKSSVANFRKKEILQFTIKAKMG
jgi:Tfp pilus assembly PilM family ATPase